MIWSYSSDEILKCDRIKEFFTDTQADGTLLIWNKKICQQNPPESLNLFLAPENITDQSQMEIEPIIVWTLDGAAIKISQNWNFGLKIFLVIAPMKKKALDGFKTI